MNQYAPYSVASKIPSGVLDSPDLHEHILSSVSDGIHVIDMDGLVLVENEASARMLGWRNDCLVGKLGHSAIHHHHADGSNFPIEDCPIYATVADGMPREVTDDVFWRQDGTSFPVEYRTAPLCDSRGNRYGVTVVFRDVTERKKTALLQASLHGISECAHDCESPGALYPQVHRIISAILPSDHLHVALVDESSGATYFPYWADDFGASPRSEHQLECKFTAKVIATGLPMLTWTADNASDLAAGQSAGNWLGVPLRADHKVVGALAVQTRGNHRRFSLGDLELLQFVSTQLATSIERTQRDAQLRRMAQFDALTNLPNRSLFNDRLDVAIAQAKRRDERLALLFIDLDKFKPVNDTFGHATGDGLLAAAAGRIQQAVRSSDTVGRIGGDEFVVALHPIRDLGDARLVAEKIRAALARPFELSTEIIRISGSIGIAIFPTQSADASQLAQAADHAMYRAKRNGGNSIVVAD